MHLTGSVTSTQTGRTYRVPDEGSCGCNNLIYLVTCKKCNLQYVGETKQTIKERFYDHFYKVKHVADPQSVPPSLKDKEPTPLGKHFGTRPHTVDDIQIQIIEFIKRPPHLTDTTKFRRRRELHWMYQLKTVDPQGINSMENVREALACT